MNLNQMRREKARLAKREANKVRFSIDSQYIYLAVGVLAGYAICFLTMGG